MTEELFFKQFKECYQDKISVTSFAGLKDSSIVLCNCKEHGDFSTTVHNLLHHKSGCPYCRLHNSKYGDKFGYDKVVFGSDRVILTCPQHGDFEVRTRYALGSDVVCPKCRYSSVRQHNGVKGRNPVAFTKWNNMIIRCFNAKYHEKQPTYETCTVCEEWLDFNNFVEWFEDPENGYREGYQLDKDLLGGGRKHYSPETCCFVPQTVNALMTRGAKIRGKVKSIGVTFRRNKYIARCNFGHKEARLIGTFDNEQDAFEAYREAKKSYIEQLAHNLYSNGEITERVYNGLLNYEIKQYD